MARRAGRRGVLAGLVMAAAGAGCAPGQTAATVPTPTVEPSPTRSAAFVIQMRMQPQEARLGTDENVVIQVNFRTREGRPVSGAQMQAIVGYPPPAGPKTFTSEITTFPDGRVDLAVPVAPATRGSNVRVEVIMRYQGQEVRQAGGFTVR